MLLVSWNVNGLRSILKKGFEDFLEKYSPDVICLQETRLSDEISMDFSSFGYKTTVFNHACKKGYSGTAIFSKIEPISIDKSVVFEPDPREGRVITAEYERFFLVNVYVPNAKQELLRLNYRANVWDVNLSDYLCDLQAKKHVILCGDLNVAHCPIDLVYPDANRYNPGFTDEERRGFDRFLKNGFVDIFRRYHPNKTGHFTWWSYRANARQKNIGWRIDYFLVSESFVSHVSNPKILANVFGSDHAPVSLEVN